MRVLLLRPVPNNERFGLGPFFRIEPLGMENVAAALEAHGQRLMDPKHYLQEYPSQPAAVGKASKANKASRHSSTSQRCA
jgi:hypothetical protein